MQRIMNRILAKERHNGVEVYLDDIVIHTKAKGKHEDLIKTVIEKLKKNSLKINKNKIQYMQGEIKVLGVTVDGKEKIMDILKIDEVEK